MYETVRDAQNAIDNSGVVEWDWGEGVDGDEVLAKLVAYCFERDADPDDHGTLSAFVADILGQDPADYSLD